jgi:hypothetical protein
MQYRGLAKLSFQLSPFLMLADRQPTRARAQRLLLKQRVAR